MSESLEETEKPLNIDIQYRNDIIKDALKTGSANPKYKITDNAVELMTEMAKIIAIETAVRSAKQATLEDKTLVTVEHLEMIMPQTLLDFA